MPRALLLLLLLGAVAASPPPGGCVLDPSLPKRLTAHAAQQLLCAGFLNASAPPYSAAGDGTTDDTAALQAALDDAYQYRLAVRMDAGRRFRLTRTLRAVQDGKPPSMREYGYQLVGGRADGGLPPPALVVADGADAAAFPAIGASTNPAAVARPVLLFALNASGQANDAPSHYSAMLRGVDIELGNNPSLSGVSMSGAQLCSLEDVRVSGAAFTAGVYGLPGSGGFSANIEVTGGQFAVWQDSFRPNPSITGLLAVNQSTAGVLLGGSRGPLVLSGFAISSARPTLLAAVLGTAKRGATASLALEDGVIDVTGGVSGARAGGGGGAAAIATGGGGGAAAIATGGADVSLRSVYVRAAVAVSVKGGAHEDGLLVKVRYFHLLLLLLPLLLLLTLPVHTRALPAPSVASSDGPTPRPAPSPSPAVRTPAPPPPAAACPPWTCQRSRRWRRPPRARCWACTAGAQASRARLRGQRNAA